jgi:hypothetical protein
MISPTLVLIPSSYGTSSMIITALWTRACQLLNWFYICTYFIGSFTLVVELVLCLYLFCEHVLARYRSGLIVEELQHGRCLRWHYFPLLLFKV